MENQKPRRRSKWLSKVFGKEEAAQTVQNQASVHGQTSSQALSDGTTRKQPATLSEQPPPPPYSKVSDTPTQTTVSSHAAEDGESSTVHYAKDKISSDPSPPPSEAPKINPQKEDNGKSKEPTGLQAPPKKQEDAIAAGFGVLNAPAVDTRKTAKGTSRTKQAEFKDEEKVPMLLDPKVSMYNAGLWEKAYSQLSENEKYKDLFIKYEVIIEEATPNKAWDASFPKKMEASVEGQIKVMKQKQWVLQWDKKEIVIRDQAQRIVKFVQTFSDLGSAIAAIDPIHVGIPWAGVCTILTLILNDSTQHQDALNGLEDISTIIGKYIAIEDVFVQSYDLNPASESNAAFESCILKVYSSVLIFQVKAALHFHKSTMARTTSNIIKSVDWTELLSTVKKADAECLAMTSMTGISNMSSEISGISESLLDIQEKWKEIQDMSATIKKLEASWEKKAKDIKAMIEWISEVQVGIDHERARTNLGERYWNSGQWFLKGPEFSTWKASVHGTFWLQGSVGTGKTSLASIVINELAKSGQNPSVGFYYCRATGQAPNNPTAIFRSLVAQLASTIDGDNVYPVIRDWYQREAKHYVAGSRLTVTQCEEHLVKLMNLRGKTIIVIDGIDECSAPMELLRSLHNVWKNFPRLKVFLTSRLDVEVNEIFHKIPTVQSDYSKTSDDIREYITQELRRKDRRNKKVITKELAERMITILVKRAQGMFRWVELQLDLLINSEWGRIKYQKDFEERLEQLELGSGQEVLASLRDTYDLIYTRNTQGTHSRRVAEKALKWALCSARPLKIWELGAAVCVDGEDKVKTDLIVSICSNFFTVDPRGFVQLAHLSVREYLEVKEVGGKLIYSPEETHAFAAYTCLLYFKNVARLKEEAKEYDVEVSVVEKNDRSEDDEDQSSEEDEIEPSAGSGAPNDAMSLNVEKYKERERSRKRDDHHQILPATDDGDAADKAFGKLVDEVWNEDKPEAAAVRSPFDAPNGDYFSLANEYLSTDSAPKLEPKMAIKRFQRYASVYWATHCEAAKKIRTDETSPLNELFWGFLEEDGANPAFAQWTTALFNETKVASLPTIEPAPMIFIPTTAHQQHILDAEPMYNRWAEVIEQVGGNQPLRPSFSLIACSYGFIDVLSELDEDGSALTTQNHMGIPGIVLATRNGYNEVLDLPISANLHLDITDKEGRTPLHHAAVNGSLELARLLLGYPRKVSRRPSKKARQVKVDVNAKDICLRTPLHLAAEYGQLEILKLLLLEENTDIHARNDLGYTALGMCGGRKELAACLRSDKRYEAEDEFEWNGMFGYVKDVTVWYRMDKLPLEDEAKETNPAPEIVLGKENQEPDAETGHEENTKLDGNYTEIYVGTAPSPAVKESIEAEADRVYREHVMARKVAESSLRNEEGS
jgi:hypothetical protein